MPTSQPLGWEWELRHAEDDHWTLRPYPSPSICTFWYFCSQSLPDTYATSLYMLLHLSICDIDFLINLVLQPPVTCLRQNYFLLLYLDWTPCYIIQINFIVELLNRDHFLNLNNYITIIWYLTITLLVTYNRIGLVNSIISTNKQICRVRGSILQFHSLKNE